ncbi:conserved membrane hypothetical protein [Burkholderia sp. 8Y]|uniref:hypothetical protein n=1 Tax=Burkholderia sp. 8Y TaxID=2653133 RepID=UPI0012F0756B|nr:hypothetical protein [Burkholderia sp. 8Y]VXC78921.1 conserved membrane hypothetical protein [Burkholderia sp. 8Y]
MSSLSLDPVPEESGTSSSSVTPIKPAKEPAPPPAASAQSRFPAEQLILQRDLNEVLLLLDFISGRPDVHIWDIGDIKYPVRPSTEANANANNGNGATSAPAALPPIEVIRRICALRYPPEPDQSLKERADDAALLLCVKDKVNSIAFPANGVTIAYTYMFLEERSRAKRNALAPPDSGLTLDKETRAVVAKSAYPGLLPSAKRFRCFHKNVSRVGAAVTFFSAILLWLVVYGMQLTFRFEDDQKSTADLTSQIYAAVDKENAALAQDKQSHDSVPVRCDSKIDQQSNQIRLLCNRWSYYQARYEKSINDAATFAETSPSSWLTMPFPISSMLLTKNKAGNPVATQENIQSITLVLSAYASYVLPVLFGLVGTIASFLRDISDRITRSILAPRDETLAIIRLMLGAIAGLAVGLFFTPGSVAQTVSSGSGVLTLSASGIAFIAGYGADGFFRMIDAMIVRVFSLDRPDKPAQAK